LKEWGYVPRIPQGQGRVGAEKYVQGGKIFIVLVMILYKFKGNTSGGERKELS